MRALCRYDGVPAAVSDVVIVGAGLAGLVCAQDLMRVGVDCTVVEA
ncbi:MAG TPA: FAD-dependent monooxygenase, partial [Acidimicrobiia bacterium]|nr:FAD-dependent monooxygenase [Acidimicrobiia bacterium]